MLIQLEVSVHPNAPNHLDERLLAARIAVRSSRTRSKWYPVVAREVSYMDVMVLMQAIRSGSAEIRFTL